MTTLRHLIKLASLDLSNLVIGRGIGVELSYEFPVSQLQFLGFAKEDLLDNTTRGYLNALTNAKRAIDCQVDTVFKSLGFLHDAQPAMVRDFVSWYENQEGAIDVSYKLRLVRSLGMAPTSLIANARSIRNKLEHYYEVPDIQVVKDAVELAELFVGAIQYKMRSFVSEFFLGTSGKTLDINHKFNSCIYFFHDSDKALFDIKVYESGSVKLKTVVTNEDVLYLHLIKLSMSIENGIDVRYVLCGCLNSSGINVPLHLLKIEFM